MCCSSNKVIKSDSKSFLAIRVLHEDKLCDTLQAMAPTNVNTVHEIFFKSRVTSIDSDCCRLPTASVLSNKAWTNHAPITFDQEVQVSQGHTHYTEIRKIEISRPMLVEALSWESRRASQHPAVQALRIPEKRPMNLARSPLLVGPRRKKTVCGQRSAFLS